MEEFGLQQPELIGRSNELSLLKRSLENALDRKGSTMFISGEAGIGKTRLVSELKKHALESGMKIIQGWCLEEGLEPLMPVKMALREANMQHLVSGDPPPMVVSAYLINEAGMLMNKVERTESGLDSDIFASMLLAVGNFVKDSLSMMEEGSPGKLNSLGYGDFTILIQSKNNLSIATVIKGANSEFLIGDMKRILEEIGDDFSDWSGNMEKVEVIQPKISWFISSGKYDGNYLVDDPKIKQDNLFDNVLMGLQRASEESPIFLYLDDLQWSDPTSLALLHFLSRNLRKNRVLVLGTYRPEDIGQASDGMPHKLETTIQAMNREDLLEIIKLERLDADNTERMIFSAMGETPLDKDLLARIFRETSGTPLYVLEVIKLLVEDEIISMADNGAWQLTTDLENVDIPSKVYDVIKRRLGRLKTDQRDILECASVIGEEFRSDIIGRVIGMNRLQTLKTLNDIEKTHKLIHSKEASYRFDHAKIKEVMYSDINSELRKEYHKMIAESIEELNQDNIDDSVSELAYHFFEARDKRAGDYLIQVGDVAKERFANAEAISFYVNALEINGRDKPDPITLSKLGNINNLIGEYDTALGFFRESLALREEAVDKKNAAETLSEIGQVYYNRGELEEAKISHTESLRIMEEIGDKQGIAASNNLIGIVHYSKNELEEALEFFNKSLAIDDELNDETGRATTYSHFGLVYHKRGEFDRALEYYEKSKDTKMKIGKKNDVATLLNNIGTIYSNLGEMDRALKYYKESLAIRMEVGDRRGIASAYNNLGTLFYKRGELKNALEHYENSLKIKIDIGVLSTLSVSYNNMGIIHREWGEFDKAMEYYEKGLAMDLDHGNKNVIAKTIINISEIMREKGQLDDSTAKYLEATDLCRECGVKVYLAQGLLGLAETYVQAGKLDLARTTCEEAETIAQESSLKTEYVGSQRILGIIFSAKKDWNEAEKRFENSLAGAKDLAAETLTAKINYFYGKMLSEKGDVDRARSLLETSLVLFNDRNMRVWIARCSKELKELD